MMGGRGGMLPEGGFVKQRYHVVDYVDGVKVLEPKDSRERLSLPERAGTPGTSYVCYRKDGTFRQFITFDENRMPIYEIDYGKHKNELSLHVHFYENGNRTDIVEYIRPGHELYEKHKKLFKGVKIWKGLI